jgi:hypothetical protein
MARPKALTQGLKEEICERIIEGETVRQIAADEHMASARTIYLALAQDETFSQQYARAKEFQLNRMEDEILDIADNATGDSVQQDKLRIDTRKWIMAKRAPKKYGERVQQDVAMIEGTAWGVVNMRSSRNSGSSQEPAAEKG